MLITTFFGIESRVLKAKNNKEEINQLIIDNKRYIFKCIQEYCRENSADFNDELTTIGMMAFKEAIETYKEDKGKFLSFAKLVIKRRLIDHYRKNKMVGQNEVLSFDDHGNASDPDLDGNANNIYEIKASITNYENDQNRDELKEEIQAYSMILSKYDLSFTEIAQHAPKNERLKNSYIQMANFIAADEGLFQKMLENGRLPIAEIQLKFGEDRKKIERGRKYILAIVLLKNSNLDRIKSYIERR